MMLNIWIDGESIHCLDNVINKMFITFTFLNGVNFYIVTILENWSFINYIVFNLINFETYLDHITSIVHFRTIIYPSRYFPQQLLVLCLFR